ncbi:29595_t:CDS:2 [Racocetra persica]|uniref:29595_t:CDS:1 n=1 Tax=Racocetra persica TaxID=160502 RepID=A0ACA9L896_9GLOM|nr:29595_t:CDS:2 [Racocetra persica]
MSDLLDDDITMSEYMEELDAQNMVPPNEGFPGFGFGSIFGLNHGFEAVLRP